MNFGIIAPSCGLDKFASLSKFHLILAHVKDKYYRDFYKKKRQEGDLIILDNGAHEKGQAITWMEICEAIEWYEPQIAVLPDKLNSPHRTLIDSIAFLESKRHKYPKVEWMFVVQGSAQSFSMSSVMELHNRYNVRHFGITRYLALNQNMKRSEVKLQIAQRLEGAYFHALGMANGSLEELHSLAKAGFDSVDSSVPVWRGCCGYEVGEPNWPEISVDFNCKEMSNEGLIYLNLKKCLEAANADTSALERSISGNGI